MPKYVILNRVNGDGMGDFTHFEDVMRALLSNPKFNDVEFIPIVSFDPLGSEANYQRVVKKLQALFEPKNIPFFYGKNSDHEKIKLDPVLQKQLSEADQVIGISMDMINVYKDYLKKGIPYKLIGEHDWGRSVEFSLGLLPKRNGIKIKNFEPTSADKAFITIKEHDPAFFRKLLTVTHSDNVDALNKNNLFIPAYFNRNTDFVSFLHFIGINHSFPKDKDLIVYHTGSRFNEFLNKNNIQGIIHSLFKESNIRRIEMIEASDDTQIAIEGNPESSQVIKILSGFYLSDPSFEAIHQLAKIAGVSGDNTFERCVSMNIFPYYFSTSGFMKEGTIEALKGITQLPELVLSLETRESYRIFFDSTERDTHSQVLLALMEGGGQVQTTPFMNINLQKMINEWPVVSAYLRKHRNFYDRLEPIILAQLTPEGKPSFFRKKPIHSTGHTRLLLEGLLLTVIGLSLAKDSNWKTAFTAFAVVYMLCAVVNASKLKQEPFKQGLLQLKQEESDTDKFNHKLR